MLGLSERILVDPRFRTLTMPTHNAALLEAYAVCPPSARIYYTLEIWQSSFAEPARVVANVGDDIMFGIDRARRATAVRW
jgi:hypothetical protein